MYWFSDENNKILYVGKAKNLKKRLSSYYRQKRLTTRIKEMTHRATKLEYTELNSELEALLVEAELIRLHQPEYNILLKDDKTPLYILISKDEFPTVTTVRKKEVDTKSVESGTILGPFPSGYKAREVLKIARTIFPWCTKRASNEPLPKACFYHHLDLCPGACVDQISKTEYKKNIQELILFLRGKKKQVVRSLEKKMLTAADAEKYEQAAALKKKIATIKTVTERQYRLKPDYTLPQLKESASQEGVLYLQKLLSQHGLAPRKLTLNRIEGYDVSNTQGKHAAVAMVTFTDGKPDKSNYRLFNIRSIDTPNDYQMMKEAIARRQNHPEWGKPDLVVIDGGKGQLRAARSVWQWNSPVISIAKKPDRIIIPTSSNLRKPTYAVHKLPENHPLLHIVQQVRDEAHRFSKKQHSRRHLKALLPD